MSIYSKENFAGNAASTANSNFDVSDSISSSVAMSLIEGYIAFQASNGSLKSVTQTLDFVSNFTKDMIDNGDLTLAQCEHIKNWVKGHSAMFTDREPNFKNKLVLKVLDNCNITCSSEEDSTALKNYLNRKAEFDRLTCETMNALGPSIKNAISQFTQRYGKSMDDSYLKQWES